MSILNCSGACGAAGATSESSRPSSIGSTPWAHRARRLVAWPIDEAGDVLRFYRDFVADAPDEVGIMANLRLIPAATGVP